MAAFLPLVRQVIATHEAGLCTHRWKDSGSSKSKAGKSDLRNPTDVHRDNNLSRMRRLLKPEAKSVEVVDQATVVRDVDTGIDECQSKKIAEHDTDLERPAWLRG